MKNSIIDLFKTAFKGNAFLADCSNDQLKKNLLNSFKVKFGLISPHKEALMMATIDDKNRILGCDLLFEGTEDCINTSNLSSLFSMIQTKSNIKKIVLAHNHPSQICLPSSSDIYFTKDLRLELKKFHVELIDHFILTRQHYFSLGENGLI